MPIINKRKKSRSRQEGLATKLLSLSWGSLLALLCWGASRCLLDSRRLSSRLGDTARLGLGENSLLLNDSWSSNTLLSWSGLSRWLRSLRCNLGRGLRSLWCSLGRRLRGLWRSLDNALLAVRLWLHGSALLDWCDLLGNCWLLLSCWFRDLWCELSGAGWA